MVKLQLNQISFLNTGDRLEKVKAVKEGREADFSDYAKYKISEDNVGFQMLKKAGWQEGSGLGSKGEGITAPINK